MMEIWKEFCKRKLALCALVIVTLFFFVGLYAPFFASSQPVALIYRDKLYFPLFRYLFYPGFYTKPIDLFYNLLMFTLPLALIGTFIFKKRYKTYFLISLIMMHLCFYCFILMGGWKDPAKQGSLKKQEEWQSELKGMHDYARLNLLLKYKQLKEQNIRLAPYVQRYESEKKKKVKTLFASDEEHEREIRNNLKETLSVAKKLSDEAMKKLPELMRAYPLLQHQLIMAKFELEEKTLLGDKAAIEQSRASYAEKEKIEQEQSRTIAGLQQKIAEHKSLLSKEKYLEDKKKWEETESEKVKILLSPLFRTFHWEDDAGGGQGLNKYLPWWELTRINRKDLGAALLFGIRISLVVGITSVFLALIVGIPLGVISGYFAGKIDIIICRLIEIWEAMPAFFMLLLIVTIVQSKSLFLVIAVLAIFSWTHFTRYIRGEVLRERNLHYVMAAKSLGFSHMRIMFSHILPNAIPPVLTLLPFAMMAAITAEAGLSFLGLGEEGSTSWGVLMAEGRSVFPGESYLLWPPAILLTILLVAIALVGDTLRDALDPKMRS